MKITIKVKDPVPATKGLERIGNVESKEMGAYWQVVRVYFTNIFNYFLIKSGRYYWYPVNRISG